MKKRIAIFFMLALVSIVHAEVGLDLYQVFKKAHAGKPLNCVALGGSITQAGNGWITENLKEKLPNALVAMHNAGMSGTGSMLGMFRLERDVINIQPDLVFIEYVVNDFSAEDDDVFWTIESIVRRLKMLKNPPAIVFLFAASEDGAKSYRHKKIADYYGLLSIDLNKKTHDYLQKNNLPWSTFFSDNVHPNAKGHDFYSKEIMKELNLYIERSVSLGSNDAIKLPKQFSSRQLIFDGKMIPIATSKNWHKENSLSGWWDRFFMGVTASSKENATLQIAFRGTVVGLFYALEKKYGTFWANVNGHDFREVVCNHRGGYGYTIFANNLPAQKHILNIALAKSDGEKNQGIKLGFLLVGGDVNASEILSEQGEISVEKLKNITKEPVSKKWWWSAPFGNIETKAADNQDLDIVFAPEQKNYNNWQELDGELVDFATLTNYKDRGVSYAKTIIESNEEKEVTLFLYLDYWAKVWINDKLVLTIADSHGSPQNYIPFKAKLKKGQNSIFLKIHSGSNGNSFLLKQIKGI